MKQQRAVKVELYPTDEQRILIHKTFGCVRACLLYTSRCV